MHIDAAELQALVSEAAGAIVGLEIRALVDAPGGGILFLLAAPNVDEIGARFLIVPQASRARAHLVPARPRPKPAPPESAFCRDARPLLRLARVVGLHVPPGERMVEIELERPDGAGRARVVAELFGSSPNLVMVDERDSIEVCLRARSGRRPVSRGAPYLPPPPRDAPDETATAAPAPFPDPPPGRFGELHPLAAAVDAVYFDRDLESARAALRLELTRALDGTIGRLEGRIRKLDAEVATAAGFERERQLGDLLSASFGRLARGLTTVAVEDVYRGGTVDVPLDPKLAPRQNIEAYYKRARKLERGGALAAERLATSRTELERVRELREEIAAAAMPTEEQQERARRWIARSGRQESARSVRAPRDRGAEPGIRRYQLRSGLDVLVGKSSRDNDRLTVRVARGNDLWLHLHGEPSSHVVIRLPRGRTASLEDIEEAAALAVHFSKRRGAERAEVMYTPKKYVRKGKGLAPGAVLVDRFKTILATATEERARAVFERSRAEDEPLP